MIRHDRRMLAGTESAQPIRDQYKTVARMTRTRLFRTSSLLYLAIGCWCLVQVTTFAYETNRFAHADDAAAASAEALTVGRSAHEPKFGERLLPLRKKSAAMIGVVGRAGSERHVNSLINNKNINSVVSHESNNPSNASASRVMVRATTSTTANGHASVKTVDQQQQVEQPLLYALHEYETFPPRQGRQLHRREDTNVLELYEPPKDTNSIGNISKADRLVVMSTEFFVVPTSTPVTLLPPTTAAPRLGAKAAVLPDYIQPPRSVLIVAPKTGSNHSNHSNATTPSSPSITATHLPFTGLRKEPWVVPVLVLASLTMLMMGAFEIFVLFKAWRTSPSRRHLFLGQMLLLGLFACAGLGAIITAQPSLLSCGAIRFGVGVAYALVFAALLVKCVFLISLNGGVYLPAPYQGLLLLFAVLIQVAIGAQWLLTQPPEIYTLSVPVIGNSLLATTVASSTAGVSTVASNFATLFHPANSAASDLYTRITATGTVLIPLCKTQFSELLFSLIYIVFLIVFVAVLAIKSRGIRDNYREATYIGLAIGGAIPIWLGWMLCGMAVAERHKDACIAFGLIATSATVFLVMFMPKGRQLAAMGKEGLYVEDREEQFSSLSRAGSGYSPSFFHFKPIKYGVMGGGMQSSATNTGNGASMKHCSNGLNGGDRVALVTAAPPSYTRMYHYFPAHLSAHPFCFYPQPPPPPPSQPPPPQLSPPPMTQLPSPPTLKQLGNSLSAMTQAHIAQTLRYPGLFIRPDETNLYTTLEPTLSSNPNVYFQRSGAVHPGMMY